MNIAAVLAITALALTALNSCGVLHLILDRYSRSRHQCRCNLAAVPNLGDEYSPEEARTIRIFDRLETRIRSIIMGAADDAVKGAVEQLNKARAEVLAQDASQDANAVSAETIQSLKDVAQSFDDLNPDPAPEPEPTPDPEPEPEA